jgi:predicted aspartyl protease
MAFAACANQRGADRGDSRGGDRHGIRRIAICAPVEVAVQLGLELVGFQTVEYADGRRTRELVFLGSVVLGGQEKRAEISLTEAQEILIGTGLLADYTLEINFPQRSVRLVPMS